MPVDLSCSFLGMRLKNPLVLASGILGTSPTLLERLADVGAGAVTSKSCSLVKREGHPNPVAVLWEHGLINAIGLSNPGAEDECRNLKAIKPRLAEKGVLLFASIFAATVEDYGRVAEKISAAEPDLIEVNISCPNVQDEFGTPFAADIHTAGAVTRTVRKATRIRISIKLAPNTPNIGRIAKAVTDEGADAITAINTMPGMIIDAYAHRPVLANRTGGISGGALKPIALRCVAEIAQSVKVPIIGTGGVGIGLDAAEMIMAGATLVGIGSAISQRGVYVFKEIGNELTNFMKEENYANLDEMRGLALR